MKYFKKQTKPQMIQASERISDDSKDTGYKIGVQMWVVFLCTSNEQLELEIYNSRGMYTSTKKMKSLGINLKKIHKTYP